VHYDLMPTNLEVTGETSARTQIYQRDSADAVSIEAVTPQGTDSGTGIVLNEKGLRQWAR
jgi:hypothetical protein